MRQRKEYIRHEGYNIKPMEVDKIWIDKSTKGFYKLTREFAYFPVFIILKSMQDYIYTQNGMKTGKNFNNCNFYNVFV